jgi:hypothetical protein
VYLKGAYGNGVCDDQHTEPSICAHKADRGFESDSGYRTRLIATAIAVREIDAKAGTEGGVV